MHLQQFAGVFEEGCALRRELHVAGRPLDQPAAEPGFEPLQLQAHRGLRRPHRFSRAGKTAELGDAHESLDGIEVEGATDHFNLL